VVRNAEENLKVSENSGNAVLLPALQHCGEHIRGIGQLFILIILNSK